MSAERLKTRQEEIKSLACEGYSVRELNDGYCYRINKTYDLYPVNNKWHHLPSGARGSTGNLKTFLLEKFSLEEAQKAVETRVLPKVPEHVEMATGMPSDPAVLNGTICGYCGTATQLVNSTEIYGRDLGLIYICRPCEAWVGVHKGTTNGKGRVANKELREWKMKAHAAFDPIWKEKIEVSGWKKKKARDYAYQWLSAQMGLQFGYCHIGWMEIEDCKRVIEICTPLFQQQIHSGQKGTEDNSTANNADVVDECPF